MTDQLGRLQSIDPRTVWANEALNFTPWLAAEENLSLLADTIGLDLELESTEKNVGPYRADIVCKDTVTDSWVLVENQLERTDHSHLGQLLTYAAGLDAVTIVWIADKFTDEHRASLDWLNEITDEAVNFFGLEIELWRIGESPIAPKFNVVSKPNDWTKSRSGSRNTGLTALGQRQLAYWQAFAQLLETRKSPIKTRTPKARHHLNAGIGRSGFLLEAFANGRESRIGVQLILHKGDVKAYFHLLQEQRTEIENAIGNRLEWMELPDVARSRIVLYLLDTDPDDRDDWSQQHEWLYEGLEAFYRVFGPRVKELDADNYTVDDEDELSPEQNS